VSEEMKQRVLKAGLYLALIQDDQFKLQTPKNFHPHCFN